MYKRILVPLDGSETAEIVLNLVSSIAKAGYTEVVLLRVVEYPLDVYAGCMEYPSFNFDQIQCVQRQKEAFRLQANEYLERVASSLMTSGIHVTTKTCDGPVVEAVLASAEKLRSDLIVLSTCGNGGGNPWVIGSVAGRILREAQVPVILVRPKGVIPITRFQVKKDDYARNVVKTAHLDRHNDTKLTWNEKVEPEGVLHKEWDYEKGNVSFSENR
jgi:nucleotide-binding universal stress UspA family protein